MAELARVLRPGGSHDSVRDTAPSSSTGRSRSATTASRGAICGSTAEASCSSGSGQRALGLVTSPIRAGRASAARTGGSGASSGWRTTTPSPSAATTGSWCGTSRPTRPHPRSRENPQPFSGQEPGHLSETRRAMITPSRAVVGGCLIAETMSRSCRPVARRHDPLVRRRPQRPVEPRGGRHGAHRWRRSPRRGRAYEWLRATQRPDGSWHTYYLANGQVKDPRLDTNVCAYVATGVWHYFLVTRDSGFLEDLWPSVRRAIDFVLGCSGRTASCCGRWTPTGPRGAMGCSPAHPRPTSRLRCGVACALARARERPDWELAAGRLAPRIAHEGRFEPKHEFAMDWYYPVLSVPRSRHGAGAHRAAVGRPS